MTTHRPPAKRLSSAPASNRDRVQGEYAEGIAADAEDSGEHAARQMEAYVMRQAVTLFNPEQMAEIRRRADDADAGHIIGEPWETVRARLHKG